MLISRERPRAASEERHSGSATLDRPVPVLVTFDFPPARGGIQHYAARLSEEFCELGFAPVVLTPRAPGAAAHDRTTAARVRRFAGCGRRLRALVELPALALTLRSVRSPHTIALSWLPGLAAAALPRRVRGTLTLLVHGTELDVRPGSTRERMMRFVFRRAERVIANSAAVAARVRELGLAAQVEVVFPGVDVTAIERRPAPTPTVVFVGRLVPRKGLDRLIDAIALLRERPLVLHVIGEGPQRAALEQRARDAGIADRVRFAGAVDDAARNAALAEAWCFAMPSRREGGDLEGFGIVYLEAAMAGLPAIGGRDCGAEDAIVDGLTGLLVDGNDPAAIAKALVAILDDRPRAEGMGVAGRRRALDAFGWRQTALAIAQLAGLEPLT